MYTVKLRAAAGAFSIGLGALFTSSAAAQEASPVIIDEVSPVIVDGGVGCGPGIIDTDGPYDPYDPYITLTAETASHQMRTTAPGPIHPNQISYDDSEVVIITPIDPGVTQPCVSAVTGSLAPGEIINHGAFINGGVSDALGDNSDGTASRDYNQGGTFFFSSSNRRQRNAVNDSKVWVKGNYSKWDGDNNSFEGDRADLVIGADTKLSNDLVVGGLIGYGKTDFTTTLVGTSSFDAKSATIGVYIGKRFANGVIFDATVTYSSVDYDVLTLGGVTGSFDADRYVVAGTIRRQYVLDNVTVEPLVSLVYARENQDAYTNSAAVAIPANSVEAGRLSAGSNFYFKPQSAGNGIVKTRLGLMGEYEWNDQNVNLATGLPDFDGVFSGRIEAGLDYVVGSSTLSANAHVAGLGSGQYTNYGLSLKFSMSF